MITTLFVALIIVVLLYRLLTKRTNDEYAKLPPGPRRWPIVGNILQLDLKQPEQTLLKWKQQYGNVYTVWLPLPSVVFVDYDAIKETFVKQGESFAGRPELFIMKDLLGGNYGLVLNDNSFYKSQRRFSLHILRDFGLGRNVLQETIIDQARKIIAIMHQTNGSNIQMKQYFTTAVGNIINTLVFGYTYEFDDQKLHKFKKLMDDLFMSMSGIGMLAIEQAPWMRHFDTIINFGYRKTKQLNDELMDFFRVEVDQHRATINYNQPPRDYTDAYLMEIERRKNDTNLEGFGDWQMLCAIADLYSAGFETTLTTLRFAIRYLIANRDIQQRIHDEIDQHIGRERDLSMDDQKRLPFLCATIQEVQRLSNILPIMLQHTVLENIEYNGYLIPKGTIVIPQTPSLHIDPNHFSNPHSFDPMRFIDADGQFIKSDKVLPFSTGKRSCLGENLARMELFLFLGSFLQKCQFLPTIDEQSKPINVEVTMNVFIRQPMPYQCRVIPRL